MEYPSAEVALTPSAPTFSTMGLSLEPTEPPKALSVISLASMDRTVRSPSLGKFTTGRASMMAPVADRLALPGVNTSAARMSPML